MLVKQGGGVGGPESPITSPDALASPDGVVPMEMGEREYEWSGVKYSSPRLRYWGPEKLENEEKGIEALFKFVWDGKESVKRSDSAESGSDDDLRGKVVLYESKSGESLEDVIRMFSTSGIAAFVSVISSFTDYPGNGNWIRDGTWPGQKFPIYEISSKTNKSLEEWSKNTTKGDFKVRLMDDKNDWERTYQVGVPIVAFYILLANGVIAVIAAYKLTLTIVEQGFRIALPHCVFGMGLMACILRIIFASSDPFCVWGYTSFLFQQVLMTISIPLTICPLFLIALYWHDMVAKSKSFKSSSNSSKKASSSDKTSSNAHSQQGKRSKSLSATRKWVAPFFIFYIIAQAIELASSALRGKYVSLFVLIFVTGAIYVFTVLGINIFFIVSRVRLQKIFNKLNESLGQRKSDQRLRLASDHFVAIVVGSFVWIVFLIIAAANIIWTPVGFPIGWIIYFSSLDVVQLGQILMIKAPQRPFKWIFCGLCHPNPSDLYDTESSSNNSKTSSQYHNSKRMSVAASRRGRDLDDL